jgi:Ca2+-transporting ATPase
VLRRQGTTPDGLSTTEAERRLSEVGPNQLASPARASAWRILLDQVRSLVVLLLAAAAAVSTAMGDLVETGAIAVVLIVNTVLGFLTELEAHRAMEALQSVDVGKAAVVRDGQLGQVPVAHLVPGDIIEIEAGQTIPADARVVAAHDLRVTEAALTGESLPVSKDGEAHLDEDTPLAERRTMTYKGTTAAAGTARAVVIATGATTEIGRIGQLVGSLGEERTPLEVRLDALGRRLVWIALGVASLVTAIGVLRGDPLGLVVEMGIALAVAAVPEALPAVATIALAVGLHRMARRHALVRRLPAVEALGSVTAVCTDKTRTLTSGEMAIVEVWARGESTDLQSSPDVALPEGGRDVLLFASLASRPHAGGDGAGTATDPVDQAAMAAAASRGIDRDAWRERHREIAIVPFSSQRQLQAVLHDDDGRVLACVKGAPGRLLKTCARISGPGGEVALSDARRDEVLAANDAMASRALRVLAVARGDVASASAEALQDLTFLGLFGLLDPPAQGVAETIETLRAAGLRTIMLTGDQRATAEAIGRRLGIVEEGQQVVDGGTVERSSPADLPALLAGAGAFSRVSPEHKLRIVEALQARGDIVAMLGDGINDAPALKKADVGVAMGGRGTDVAREAADIVLRDDRFETIAAAVEEGRVIYANIRKFVFYLFSCNLAEVLVLLVPGVLGWPHPLLPLHILWLNMVTDTFPALALAMEPADPSVMRRPPRSPQEALLSAPFLRRVGLYAVLITASTLAAFLWSLEADVARARTIAFTTLAIAQILHLGNARRAGPVMAPRLMVANTYALAAVALSLALQIVAVQFAPLAAVLDLTPLAAGEWALAVGLGAVPAVVGQALKSARTSR